MNPLSEEKMRRARERLDAYGADKARWPADDRHLFDPALADLSLTHIFENAAALDRALSAASPPPLNAALSSKILARFTTTPKRRVFEWFFRLPRLVAAAGLAATMTLGFVSGAATAQRNDVYQFAPSPLLTADEESEFWGDEA